MVITAQTLLPARNFTTLANLQDINLLSWNCYNHTDRISAGPDLSTHYCCWWSSSCCCSQLQWPGAQLPAHLPSSLWDSNCAMLDRQDSRSTRFLSSKSSLGTELFHSRLLPFLIKGSCPIKQLRLLGSQSCCTARGYVRGQWQMCSKADVDRWQQLIMATLKQEGAWKSCSRFSRWLFPLLWFIAFTL